MYAKQHSHVLCRRGRLQVVLLTSVNSTCEMNMNCPKYLLDTSLGSREEEQWIHICSTHIPFKSHIHMLNALLYIKRPESWSERPIYFPAEKMIYNWVLSRLITMTQNPFQSLSDTPKFWVQATEDKIEHEEDEILGSRPITYIWTTEWMDKIMYS